MFSLFVALFLLAVSSACGQRAVPSDLDDFIDRQMEAHNAMLTARGIESVPLPAGSTGGLHFSKGLQHNANTMKRTGKGLAKRSTDAISYKYPLGYEKLAFSFDEITFEDGSKVQNPRLKVAGPQAFAFDFTVSERPECKVTLDEYKFVKLEGIRDESNSLSSDQLAKVSAVILDHVNSMIVKKKGGVERHLQALCNPPKGFPVTHESH